jgi:hypothetical protein
MKFATEKELVHVFINRSDEPFTINQLAQRIANATEGEKAEAEQLKKELAEQEEAKKQAEEKKRQLAFDEAAEIAD